jgi:hypothetical protein
MRLFTLAVVFGMARAIFAQDAATPRRDASWVDKETGLEWATADNAFGVTWTQASNYCRALTLGGHKNWTLPAIDELQGLFGGPPDQNGHHVKGPIAITGWAWSLSPGRESGEEWALDFGDGGRASVVMGDSGLNRALCVRHTAASKK